MTKKFLLYLFLLLTVYSCSSPVYHAVYRTRTTPSNFYPNMLPVLGGPIDSTYIPGYKKVKSYFISQYEITNAQFAFFLNHLKDSTWWNPSVAYHFIKLDAAGKIYLDTANQYVVKEHYENYPVVNVTFKGAEYYTIWLTRQLQPHFQQDKYSFIRNVIYRLPLQIEWFYAASNGGKVTPAQKYYSSDRTDEVAWYSGNTTTVQPAGQKKPNDFNLFDMNGNVYEWCVAPHFYGNNWEIDPTTAWSHTPATSAICGGSYTSGKDQLDIFKVTKYNADSARYDVGFRIVQTYLSQH